ncbi:hypothetical protein LCGC14_1360560 [marine sediment metagenome]|uniref:Uncharacterized protein n=1 Tax=marine sediment metagenome TaxID=412755 RepID=A0A0F9MNN1_9ZZZZ
MTKKKSEPNPIEEAIGERAKDPKAQEKFTKEYQTEPIGSIPDEPSPQEMLTLEELNRQTEERYQDQYPEEKIDQMMAQTEKEATVFHVVPKVPIIPVLKPDPQPVTENSSQESPPQKTESDERSEKAFEITKNIKKTNEQTLQEVNSGLSLEEEQMQKKMFGDKIVSPAEDIELTALRKFIIGTGFVLSGVSYHIVALCSQAMMIPSTTTWDFKDRANVPDMVLALLRQPGYIEGIWPTLKVVMGTNIGNETWTAGIATTLAFFDTVRMLPVLKEMKVLEDEKKS